MPCGAEPAVRAAVETSGLVSGEASWMYWSGMTSRTVRFAFSAASSLGETVADRALMTEYVLRFRAPVACS